MFSLFIFEKFDLNDLLIIYCRMTVRSSFLILELFNGTDYLSSIVLNGSKSDSN